MRVFDDEGRVGINSVSFKEDGNNEVAEDAEVRWISTITSSKEMDVKDTDRAGSGKSSCVIIKRLPEYPASNK